MIPKWLKEWFGRLDSDPKQSGDNADSFPGEFMDDHQETHAVAAGFGLGVTLGAAGEFKMLGAIVLAVVYGVRSGPKGSLPGKLFEPKLWEDIKNERHYFIAAVGLGLVIGVTLGGGIASLPL